MSFSGLYRSVDREMAAYAPYLTARDSFAHTDQTLLTHLASLQTILTYVGGVLTAVIGRVVERVGDRALDHALEHTEDRDVDAVLDRVAATASRFGQELTAAREGPPDTDEAARIAAAVRAAEAVVKPALPYVAAATVVDGGVAFEAALKQTALFLQETFDLPPGQAARLAATVGDRLRESVMASAPQPP